MMTDTTELVRLAKARLAELEREAKRLRDLVSFYEPPVPASAPSSHPGRAPIHRGPAADIGGRSLSQTWESILRFIGEQRKAGYPAMERFAAQRGIQVTRENLRSQMATYRKRGLVKSRGQGMWSLTDVGRARVGLQNEGAGAPGEQPAPSPDIESKSDLWDGTSQIALLNSSAAR
jgi:hypothetical protein